MKNKLLIVILIVAIVALAAVATLFGLKAKDNKSEVDELNSKVEELTQKVEQKDSTIDEVKNIVNGAQKEETTSTAGKLAVYGDSNRGVTIALAQYKNADGNNLQNVVITIETTNSIDFMYGEYYETQGQTYLHFRQDIAELRLNGIDGIEVSPNTNGGTNVKVTVTDNAIIIGNGTLNRI